MTATLIAEAYNPSPGPNGSVVLTSGGGWTAGNYCFRAVAWYDPTGAETNLDRAGVNRSAVAAWDNVAIGSNEQITSLGFTRPTIGNTNIPMPYHHISLYVIESSTPDMAATWRKLAETTSRMQLSFAVPDDVFGGSIVFNANGARVSINPLVAPIITVPRTRLIEVAAGIPLPVSLAADTWAKRIRFGVTFDALAFSDASRLLAWEQFATHCILVETEEMDEESDAPVEFWEGFFVDSAWVHRAYSLGEEAGGRFFDFWVTRTSLSETLPITDPDPS